VNAPRLSRQTAFKRAPPGERRMMGMSPNEALRLEAKLASLLADRDALDAKRETLNAEIAAAREALRIGRLKQQQAQQAPSAIERSHERLAQIRQWVEAGESANEVAQRLTVGVERARVLMRQAKALAMQSPAPPAPPRYKREQWIESFEGQLAILRPHLTHRLLDSISLQAWHQHGRSNAEPVQCAKDWAATK
jgi:predicted RNA binding protein with dsRBD fold (UPF0201 family)